MSNPGLILARARYWTWERRNPDKPWLCPGSVEFCDRNLDRTMIGLEFGSGRGTAWFARKLGSLISIEHEPDWYTRVRSGLMLQGLENVDYRLILPDQAESVPESLAGTSLPHYAAVANEFPDQSFDLVVVDGHYRMDCIQNSLTKIRAGGLLLLDDFDRWPDRSRLPVPMDWPVADLSSNGLKQTCIWRRPS